MGLTERASTRAMKGVKPTPYKPRCPGHDLPAYPGPHRIQGIAVVAIGDSPKLHALSEKGAAASTLTRKRLTNQRTAFVNIVLTMFLLLLGMQAAFVVTRSDTAATPGVKV